MAGKEEASAEENASWWRRDDEQSVKGWATECFNVAFSFIFD